MTRKELGTWGETLAADYLEKKGYRIVARNYRCRTGEIDLIARERDVLAFVEVKLRKNDAYGEAREFVTSSKQRKIMSAARWYLMEHPGAAELQLRYDVVEVYAPRGAEGPATVKHLEDAFE